ncbi:hypothetical protein [Clostridium sp. BL-8]|uniref:hypothetical protein n=1 Tax=Clostridium sp. BL-8 TaxID=349938 RepID=UPI00098CAD90|nr:hypothetical protein [Clostridium sp. BL-8]
MCKRFYIKKEYGYVLKESISVFLKYRNTIIYNKKNEKVNVSNSNGIFSAQVLESISSIYMEKYNSGQDALSKCRPEFLVVQNIISFFGGIPITVYDEIGPSSWSIIDDYNYDLINKSNDIKLIIDDKDYTNQLLKLMEKLEDKSNGNDKLIISLLDRWRKANYLMLESCDANLYHDESILSYFHIIELFAETFSEELKKTLDDSMEKLLYSYYNDNLFYNEKQIRSKINSLKDITGEILIRKELSLAQKIKYFLKKYGLLDINVSNFIDLSIKVRNSIAHGRLTYKEEVIYPLPPFFYLANNSYNILEVLNFLTARMISAYIGIDCWKEEWEEEKGYLMPPADTLSGFLKDKNEFNSINEKSLCEGNEYNITWNTIFKHYIENPKKFNINRIMDSLKEYFINAIVTEENSKDILNISVVLSDCNDIEGKEKAINNVKYINDELVSRSELKDLNNYLEYNNVSSEWFKAYLYEKYI